MYIKWIVCYVKYDKKQEFSIAQEKWHKTDIVKGFIAQTGGWDSKNKNIACIISFWKSKIHLENFMKNIHDNIFDENKQVDTYNSITVQYFSSLFNTKTNIQLFKKNIQNSQLLKISNYNFKNSKEKHYERVQDDNWFLEMKKTKNILKGLLLKSSSKTSNYLVTTFWNNSGNHNIYIPNKLEKLKLKADEVSDIEKITRKQVLLVDSWKIISKT